MSTKEALEVSLQKNLDLVKIAPTATPPVCRIMDYGKYRFEQAKREKEARKNQHVVEIKEIRLSLNIDVHDFNTKAGHAKRFLKEGNKVKGFHPLPRKGNGPSRNRAQHHEAVCRDAQRGSERGKAA